MTRRRSTYSMPGSSGHDDFRAKQEPQFEPVDALSRFVLDRIREAETEPVADQVEPFEQPMAYRYARYVRRDMVVFRWQVAFYLDAAAKYRDSGSRDQSYMTGAATAAMHSVIALANRWSDHHEFREEWRMS